jgi:hypothetical protein
MRAGAALCLGDHLERPMLEVLLDSTVIRLPFNQAFDIEDSVVGIRGGLILSSITNQALCAAGAACCELAPFVSMRFGPQYGGGNPCRGKEMGRRRFSRKGGGASKDPNTGVD